MTKQKKVRFTLVFIGLLFFFNPYVAVIDLLPDFIGSFLIWLGLSRTMFVNRELAETRAAFLKLMLVDIVKNFLLVIVTGAGSAEQPTALLLIAFAATVAELFFLVPAFKSLFEGLSSLTTLEDCPALYVTQSRGRSRLDLFQRQTYIFLFLRELLCLLPEFTSLSISAYDSDLINLYQYIGALRALAFVAVLALGIVWLVRLIVLFVRMWREKTFFARVDEKYATYIASHPGTAVERRYAAVFLLIFVGALFFTDFYLDFTNVIPDGVGALLLLVSVFLIDVRAPRLKIATAAFSALYGVIATYSSRLSYRFAVDFGASAIDRSEEAAAAYRTMWLFSLLELLLFVALIVLLLLLIHRIVVEHAGYLPEKMQTEFDERARKQFVEEFDLSLVRIGVVGFLGGLCSFLYDFIQQTPNNIWARLIEYSWMLDFALGIVFAFLFGNLLLEVYKEIKNRFLYD